jgi:predicted nucleic acid-binding protein
VTVLVDSDILIEVSRGQNEDIVSRWTELSQSDNSILYSPVSAAELWAGVRPREHETLTNPFERSYAFPSTEKPVSKPVIFSGNTTRVTASSWRTH